MFGEARTAAQVAGLPLRFRLFVGSSAPELHGLRWETLRSPDDDSRLSVDENILFSRLSGSADWRSAGLRPKGELTALVVIANPQGGDRYRPGGRELAPIDVAAELARAQAGLVGLRFTALDSGGRATLAGIAAATSRRPRRAVASRLPRLPRRRGVDAPARGHQRPGGPGIRPDVDRRAVTAAATAPLGRAGVVPEWWDGRCHGDRRRRAGRPGPDDGRSRHSRRHRDAGQRVHGDRRGVHAAFFTELGRDGQIDRAMAAVVAMSASASIGGCPCST